MSYSITYTTYDNGEVFVRIVLPEMDVDPKYYKTGELEPLPARVQSILEKNRVLTDIYTSGNTITAKSTGSVSSEKLHIPVSNSVSIYVSENPTVEHRHY